MKPIQILRNNGTNSGYCRECKEYFKKGDYFLIFERVKVDRIYPYRLCLPCIIKKIADAMGWEKLSAWIIEKTQDNI